jgi:hypothetical protein
MSETRHYIIRCNATLCNAREMGENDEPPSKMRPKLKTRGWASRQHPPTASQRKIGIYPTWKDDYCPAHAHLAKEEDHV